ncbi:MAG: type V CRISPR-associated endonuclease Cas1 [Patescibacteria group bacterium]
MKNAFTGTFAFKDMISLPDFKEKQILFVQINWGERGFLKFGNENIVFYKDGKIENQASCHKVFAIFIIGDMAITSNLIKESKKHGISIFLMRYNFEVYADITASAEGNYLLRSRQYNVLPTEERSIARRIVKNKINNQLALLKYKDPNFDIKTKKDEVGEKIDKTFDEKILLGVEGNISRVFFASYFESMGWYRRMPRAKPDICNLLMDMGYTFLFNFVDAILKLHGFDTYKGVYHKLFFQRKSLSCDIMEPFRCIIEKQIIKSYNLKQINEDDFEISNGKYYLKIDKHRKYAQIFMQAILDEKEEIFIFIREYYKYIIGIGNKSFPEFNLKIK